MGVNRNSPRAMATEARLPEALRPIYWRMADEYAFLTKTRHGRDFVAFDVLADMVLAGWRPSAEAHPDSKL